MVNTKLSTFLFFAMLTEVSNVYRKINSSFFRPGWGRRL